MEESKSGVNKQRVRERGGRMGGRLEGGKENNILANKHTEDKVHGASKTRGDAKRDKKGEA